MAWTTPRTWVGTDVPSHQTTGSEYSFNTYIRDNLAILKTSVSDTGKLQGFTSDYLADLSGTGVSGLVKLSGVPAWQGLVGGTESAGAITKTATTGWNCGARSIESRASGTFARARWVVPAISNIAFGLSADDPAGSRDAVDYCINLVTNGSADSVIYENGVSKLASQTFSTGDVLDVEVSTGNTVTYYKNGTLLYTSLTSAATTLYLVVCVYTNATVFSGADWSKVGDYSGKQSFYSAGSVVIPVGTDKFDGRSGAKTAGSLWVEGDNFHYVDAGASEWYFAGLLVGTPAPTAEAGSIWVDSSDGMLHYIDASNVERKVWSNSSPHTDAAAAVGSLWVEGDYMHIIAGSGVERTCHYDVSHSDGSPHTDTDYGDHSDVAHDDTAHSDYTVPHTDHTDGGHADVPYSHGDTSHVDTPHTDHSNDSHSDHTVHSDVAHQDNPTEVGA